MQTYQQICYFSHQGVSEQLSENEKWGKQLLFGRILDPFYQLKH